VGNGIKDFNLELSTYFGMVPMIGGDSAADIAKTVTMVSIPSGKRRGNGSNPWSAIEATRGV
jgi:hypothetical protein